MLLKRNWTTDLTLGSEKVYSCPIQGFREGCNQISLNPDITKIGLTLDPHGP